MDGALRILHLEDDRRDADMVRDVLEAGGVACEIELARSRDEFVAALDRGGIDLIIADYSLPSFDGMSALRIAAERTPNVPFIFVSGTLGEEVAVQALKLGAMDYVLKERMSRIVSAVRNALREAQYRAERARADEQLRASEARFRTFVDHARDAFFLLDHELRVIDVNQQACESLGYAREELIGMHPRDFDNALDPPDFARLAERARASEALTFETRHRRKDGSEFPVEIRTRAFEQGGKLFYLALARDISERLRAAEERENLRLRQLAREFELGVEARVAERTRIARELHDTLLQTFYGSLLQFQTAWDLFPTRPLQAREILGQAIDQAGKAVNEGREAVQGLRAALGSAEDPEDLVAAIEALGEEFAASPSPNRAASLRLGVTGPVRPLHPSVRGEIYRIAGEALRNAFQHSEGAQIEVILQYDEHEFRLRVRDDGKGIDANVLAEGRREGHYGLCGMRERADLVRGKLDIRSKPHAGTEVELTIVASHAYVTASAPSRS
jgi:PAS domain S-box-containing protein